MIDILVRELSTITLDNKIYYKCPNGKLLSKDIIDTCEINFNNWTKSIKDSLHD